MHSELDSYALTFCANCEQKTGFDGWGMGIGGVVNFYCLDCGKKKGTAHFSEVKDNALRREILEVITYEDSE